MNQITSRVDFDDKKMKVDKFKLKENRPRHSPRRSIIIYWSSSLITSFSSWWLQCFSLDFSDPFTMEGLFYYIILFRRSWPSTCWSSNLLLKCLSHQIPSQAFCVLRQPMQHCSRHHTCGIYHSHKFLFLTSLSNLSLSGIRT